MSKQTAGGKSIALTPLKPEQLLNVKAEEVTFKGHKALRVAETANIAANAVTMALPPELEFQDGVIEVEVAGEPAPNAPEGCAVARTD